MTISLRKQVLERVLAWSIEPVRDRVARRPDLELDVPLLITELAEVDVCSLLTTLAEELDEPALHDFFCYVLAEDPSRAGNTTVRMEQMFEEQPFPRYVVALLYLMVMNCGEHDFRALTDRIWDNILACRHLFWPELLTAVLLRVESAEALLERALLLASSQVEHERFLGENLLYGLPIQRKALRKRLKEPSRAGLLSLAAGLIIDVLFVSAVVAQYVWYKRCDALGPLDLGGIVVARECVEPAVLKLAVGFTSIAAFMAAYLLLRVEQKLWKTWQRVLLIVARVLALCLVAPALPLAWNFLVWVGRRLL